MSMNGVNFSVAAPATAQKQLVTQEGRINSAMASIRQSFRTIGLALETVRDEELYKVAGFKTFKDYVESKWGIPCGRAYKYITAARVAADVPEITLESHAREIAFLAPGDRRVAFLEAKRIAGESPVQASHVREAANRFREKSGSPQRALPASSELMAALRENSVEQDVELRSCGVAPGDFYCLKSEGVVAVVADPGPISAQAPLLIGRLLAALHEHGSRGDAGVIVSPTPDAGTEFHSLISDNDFVVMLPSAYAAKARRFVARSRSVS